MPSKWKRFVCKCSACWCRSCNRSKWRTEIGPNKINNAISVLILTGGHLLCALLGLHPNVYYHFGHVRTPLFCATQFAISLQFHLIGDNPKKTNNDKIGTQLRAHFYLYIVDGKRWHSLLFAIVCLIETQLECYRILLIFRISLNLLSLLRKKHTNIAIRFALIAAILQTH